MEKRLIHQHFRSVALFLVSVILTGCATQVGVMPQWITVAAPSPEDGVSIVAYGLGEDPRTAQERLENDAADQVVQVLLRRLDQPVGVVAPEIGAAVEQLGTDRVPELRVLDRYRRTDADGQPERYALYEYPEEQIQADLVTLRSLLGGTGLAGAAGVPAGGGGPMAEVQELLGQTIPGTADARRSILEESLAAAQRVSISMLPETQEMDLVSAQPTEYLLSYTDRQNREALTGLALEVHVQGPLVDGRREIDRFPTRTNDRGSVRFTLAPPAVVGTTSVTVEPSWLSSTRTRWESVIADRALADLLDSVSEQLTVRSMVRVASRAAQIPTAVIVVDRDIAGNAIDGDNALRGALQEFSDAGFRVRQVEISAAAQEQLVSAQDLTVSDLYDLLPFDVLAQMDRVVVGTVRIVEFNETDGISVAVDVSAGAFDLRRDQVLVRQEFQERITGSDARSAIRATFQAAGRRLARRIVPRLP